MGGVCSTHKSEENFNQVLFGTHDGKWPLYRSSSRWSTLKSALKIYNGSSWSVPMWFRIQTIEYCNYQALPTE
jgi:hypothetical protein